MNRHVNPEDSDLYALGALDGEEKQELEAHLRSCAECAREVGAARQRVALLALAAGMPSPTPALVSLALMEMPRLGRLERMPAETAMSKPVRRLEDAVDTEEERSRSRRAAAAEQTMMPAMARSVPRR